MVAQSAEIPAPIGGWDRRNATAAMPPQNAKIMDNWFPLTDRVTVRPGYSEHATGLGSSVETLVAYQPTSGANEMFAATADGDIYDVTTAGAVGAAAVTGLTNGRFQCCQMTNAAGSHLFMFNGADAPRLYSGSTWGTMSVSGPTAANLVWGNTHQQRLWVGEEGSLSAWYLGLNAISSTATEFLLGSFATKGGYLVGMATWTYDGGAGQDDLAVFLTSEGQAIIYAGTDPSSADTWALQGVFDLPRPIGRRCWVKIGADLIIITEKGFIPLSQSLRTDRAQMDAVSLSVQIDTAVADAARNGAGFFGWEPLIYPRGEMLIFNIPQSASEFHQFVFNSLTNAPCRFTGIPARCWAMLGDAPFFGGDGAVYAFDDSSKTDAGAAIAADCCQAFVDFGSSGMKKRFSHIEPVMQSDGDFEIALDTGVDYQLPRIINPFYAPEYASTGAIWGKMAWGEWTWPSSAETFSGWIGADAVGRSIAVRMRCQDTNSRPSWVATCFQWIPSTGPV